MKYDELDSRAPWEQDTYQIGTTPTPRPSRGPMAVMLVLIVILAGLLSMSGMLNVRLFATLYSQDPTEAPLSLEENAVHSIPEGKFIVTLEVKDGRIRFIDSKCPDHLCEGFGFIQHEDESAICMPAGVAVLITDER